MSDPHSGVVEALRAALAAVDAAGVPAELREVAFGKAFDAAYGAPAPVRRREVPSRPQGERDGEPGSPPSADWVSQLSAKMAVDPPIVERAYDFDSEGLHLTVSGRTLGSEGAMKAMEWVARLVIAGRQAAGLEEWTDANTVREVCHERGAWSEGNFGKIWREIDGDGFRLRGSMRSREAKANARGFEETGALVRRLVAET